MSKWHGVEFTVTEICGRCNIPHWAAVEIVIDSAVVRAVCVKWPATPDRLLGEKFTGRAREQDDGSLRLACVEYADAPVPDLASFAYKPASKRPATSIGVTRWSTSGGGKGDLALIDDDTLAMVLDLVADDRLLAPIRRVNKRMRAMVDAAIKRVLSLSDDQLVVYKAVLEQRKSVMLMGPAGCGKSHLLRILCARMPRVVVTASTGAAAEKLGDGATTVHSAMGMGLGTAEVGQLVRMHKSGKTRASVTIRDMRSLVIDEISMITAKFLDTMLEMLNKLGKERVQFVLCGDPLQLDAVKAREELPFFKSRFFLDGMVDTHVLSTSHRQADSTFVAILNRARVGNATDADVEWLEANSAQEESDRPRLMCVNRQADAYNHRRMSELDGTEVTYTAVDGGSEPWIRRLSGPTQVKLKVDARVMLVKNLHPLGSRYHNGAMGTVTRLSAAAVTVRFDHGALCATLYPSEFEVRHDKTGEVLATRKVVPLVVAFAISIHKSQGSSLDSVHVDLSRCFACAQAYVGISRAREVGALYLAGLTLSRLNNVNKEALAWYKSIQRGPCRV